MKTISDKATRDALINRIKTVTENNKAQWGNMNVFQMVKHGRLSQEMIIGQLPVKRVFIGRLFGRMILKQVLKDDSPMRRNSPTVPELKVDEMHVDLAIEKNKWITLLEQYEKFPNPNFIHPFFGKMTKEEIGIHAYKHIDHHLRQFNS